MALHTARAFGIEEDIIERAAQLGVKYDDLWFESSRPSITADEDILRFPVVKQDRLSQVASRNQRHHYSLENDIMPIVRDVIEHMKSASAETMSSETAHPYLSVIVENGWEPPGAMEGHHVVYVLQFQRGQVWLQRRISHMICALLMSFWHTAAG
jgi:hypothetical protein